MKGKVMAKQQTPAHRADQGRIDIEADEKLRAWADSFGFEPAQVAAAIGVVGDCPDAVCRHLHHVHSGRLRPRARRGSPIR